MRIAIAERAVHAPPGSSPSRAAAPLRTSFARVAGRRLSGLVGLGGLVGLVGRQLSRPRHALVQQGALAVDDEAGLQGLDQRAKAGHDAGFLGGGAPLLGAQPSALRLPQAISRHLAIVVPKLAELGIVAD